MVQKECLFLTTCQTQQELFAQGTAFLVEKGYVTAEFQKALEEREKEFPTGLPTSPEVAIPHTDGTYVKKDGILCVLNQTKIEFNEMGGELDEFVYPQLFFFIVIQEGANHLTQLERLVGRIQEGELTQKCLETQELEQFKHVVNQYL